MVSLKNTDISFKPKESKLQLEARLQNQLLLQKQAIKHTHSQFNALYITTVLVILV